MTVTHTSRTPTGAAAPPGGEAVTELTVESVEHAAADVIKLTLRAEDSGPLPMWTPGSHVDVIIDEATVRQYSLCGDPDDVRRWQIAVRRVPDGRGGSIRLHDQVTEGSVLTVRGPRNGFPLVSEAPRYVFLAGGIGITPLLPMMAELARRGAHWQLHYGGRTRSAMPFLAELSTYGNRVVSRPEDEEGLLDLQAICADLEPGTAVYCCGPEPMIEATEQICETRDDVTLHVERFAPKQNAILEPESAFEVYCSTSDLTFTVPPGRSILEVAQEAGLELLSSCMEGTCGTCEVDVLEGLPDHRDSFLSPQERASNESMMICVSRCLGTKLTIDI
ncbi:2Fe-2S iron-sulfur cluster binding domain protein [Mycobacterium parascrofulaceum ATCC BAA-614]|uniref:2Fe-2S iron-sulfur cluster binding domain protein n=1 Tax=Mycobacterium parascrofulaceum ATCC BAA-614 TaxID=525368 RepID=D5P5Y5_9MYCO|nr:PDR/VanB family oxidoreductase [Mycobacterium parascrofulaceum]EFG78514.1 2Fe-2S iron-sulfur cluster binding domain protein [Mycobacterium parascrofulaceum ATCC BAA-614]